MITVMGSDITKILPVRPVVYTTVGKKVTNQINGYTTSKTKINITKDVKLTANNKVVTISPDGTITANKKGTAVITVRYNNLKVTYKIIVR